MSENPRLEALREVATRTRLRILTYLPDRRGGRGAAVKTLRRMLREINEMIDEERCAEFERERLPVYELSNETIEKLRAEAREGDLRNARRLIAAHEAKT